MILVTGASGQLGRLTIAALLRKHPASEIIAGVRNPASVQDLADQGVGVRHLDYNEPATLEAAFAGIDKVLLISSNALGHRAAQHRAAIEAAERAGVKLLAYTSILHADSTPLGLGSEHMETETALSESSVPHVLLRNGWYTENYTVGIPNALEHGAILGSAGEGRISSATRQDFAEATAAVLTSSEDQAGKIYELAGDTSYTLAELAAEVASQSGKPVVYKDLPQEEYKAALISFGLPPEIAELLSDSDVGASKGGLFDESHHLSQLIGRPTTPLADAVASALNGARK